MTAADRHPELPDDPDIASGPLTADAMALVILGGALGTATRYALSLGMTGSGWPTATFLANLVGCFVLGALLESLARTGPDNGWRRRTRLALGTGFCGGLTTYSTFVVETDLLVRAHRDGLAVGYAVATLVLGAVMATLGIAVAASRSRRVEVRAETRAETRVEEDHG